MSVPLSKPLLEWLEVLSDERQAAILCELQIATQAIFADLLRRSHPHLSDHQLFGLGKPNLRDVE